jgi:hypothetical protein
VCVALVIQHALRMRRIVPLYDSFPNLSQTTRFSKEEKFIGLKMCVLIFSTTFVLSISHSKRNSARCCIKMSIDLHVKHRYSCQSLMKLEFPHPFFSKNSKKSNFMKIR